MSLAFSAFQLQGSVVDDIFDKSQFELGEVEEWEMWVECAKRAIAICVRPSRGKKLVASSHQVKERTTLDKIFPTFSLIDCSESSTRPSAAKCSENSACRIDEGALLGRHCDTHD
jgi:hypothetical protein